MGTAEEDDAERWGRFVLVKRLPKGGMGSAWIAVDTRDGRIAVLKRPNATDGDVERFRDEVKLTHALGKHPHLVEPIDSGAVDGDEYLELEWITGPNVETLLERAGRFGKRVSPSVAACVVRQVCEALDYAHSRDGFVHRDVKPANIVVRYDGVAKLIDYGGALSKFKRTKTEAGHVFGSVGYIAPELLKGQPPTERCDQYGAGAVLYFMLTGVPPFGDGCDGNNKESLRHRLAELKAPELPDALLTALWRALQANPRNRYESAGEMAKALAVAAPGSAEETGAFVSSIFPVEKRHDQENAEEWRTRYAPPQAKPEPTAVVRAPELAPGSGANGRSTMVIDRVPRTRAPLLVAITLVTAVLVAGAIWLAREISQEDRKEGTRETGKEVASSVPASPVVVATSLPPPVEPVLPTAAPVGPLPNTPSPVAAAPSSKPPAASLRKLEQARAFIREGKTIKAGDLLDELGQDSRLSSLVQTARAELAAQEGDYQRAIALASAAVKLGGGARAFVVKADAEMRAGRFDQAERDYDRALKLEPRNEDAREGKRLAHEKQLTKGSE